MQPSTYKHTAGFESLMATVVYQALTDLNKSKRLKKDAQKFLLSQDCQNYCDALNFDYNLIRRINFSNPEKSLNFGCSLKTLTVNDTFENDYAEREIISIQI